MKGMISVSSSIIATLTLALGYGLIPLWSGAMLVAIMGLAWLVRKLVLIKG